MRPAPISALLLRPRIALLAAVLTGLAFGLWSLPGLLLPRYIEGIQCPLSTFQHRALFADATVYGMLIGAFSWAMLAVSVGKKIVLWRFANDFRPGLRPYYDRHLLILSIVGVLIWGVLTFDGAESYFCATPGGILVRQGYFDTPQYHSWDGVGVVRAWCNFWRPRYGKSYRDAGARLSFRGGGTIVFALVDDDGRILMNDYQALRRSLEGRKYSYEIDPTVTPALCPAELYLPLRNW